MTYHPRLTVTLDHQASRHGVPVIIDHNGRVVPLRDGIRSILERHKIDPSRFAAWCNILPTTLIKYGYRDIPAPANVLNLLAMLHHEPVKFRRYVQHSNSELTDVEKKALLLSDRGSKLQDIANELGFGSRQAAQQIIMAARGKLP